MANYDKAYKLLERWENRGNIVYSQIKQDKGGETVYGVARKLHPNNPIWGKVDKLKVKLHQEYKEQGLSIEEYSKKFAEDISLKINNDALIKQDAIMFFYTEFWLKLKCDIIPNQAFAENLFLLGVNAGLRRGIRVGQKACGVNDDGIIGKITTNAFINATDDNVKKFNEIEIEYYTSLVRKNPEYEIFRKGWLNRANAI